MASTGSGREVEEEYYPDLKSGCSLAALGKANLEPKEKTMSETRVPACCAGDVSDADMAKLSEMLKIGFAAQKIKKWPTICMVPMELRRGDDNGCYDPVAVQIGLRRRPHSGVEISQCSGIKMGTEDVRKGLPQELQGLEQYKSSCVKKLFRRRLDKKKLLMELLGNPKLKDIDAWHSNMVDSGTETMRTVCTMVTDGCFILHRLLKSAHLADREAAKKTTQGGDGGGEEVRRTIRRQPPRAVPSVARAGASRARGSSEAVPSVARVGASRAGASRSPGSSEVVPSVARVGASRAGASRSPGSSEAVPSVARARVGVVLWIITRGGASRAGASRAGGSSEAVPSVALARVGASRVGASRSPGSSEMENDDSDDDAQTGGRCFVWELVTRDLLLLENQIPFLVILELFKTLKNKNENNETLVKGSLMLFRALFPQMLPHSVSVSDIAKKLDHVHHLLHLFYLMVGRGLQDPAGPGVNKPGATAKNEKTEPDGPSDDDVLPSELPQWIPGAKELLEAGIRLKKRKNATTFLDIKFDIRSGVLEIPPLQLYDHSEPLFRNMIAFEQTYPRTQCDISIYSVFMSCLVSTAEDARILHLRGILVNMMNGSDPDGGRRFFDRICSQIHFPSNNYLVHTMADVNKYIQSRHHRWRAALVRDYFSNPWVAISVVAAVFLLCLTVLQTVFTVYPYFKPSK